ncbi:MAG: D-glycero-beta-D-manno-heptose 1,7-bisphosphate 7-phosphatase [Gammaproteobacteria bacterium]|jgi:D-glycero-D-manno-heptose 1,7-bisphosphate phosphatase|nr:D-glycero-beta-D-manno-heptose 1,7-bisphosphate 7-phosphatase [Gammaproteobacteria bacterium]
MKLLVLDRDGVINQDSDTYIKSVEEWLPIPGSLEAMARLYQGGFRMAIASNQSGLGRQLFTIDDLNAIHRRMARDLASLGCQVEAIFFCPHTPEVKCFCRKPLPGLLHEVASRFQIDLSGVPCVGDSWRDLEAAIAVGASPILVRSGKGQQTQAAHALNLISLDIPVYADLAEVADQLLVA